MSTSCSTIVKENGYAIVRMTRHCDGYLEGHGVDLANFLKNIKLVNGFSLNTTNQANGMGCLAAQIVAHFKTSVGGFYLYNIHGTDEIAEQDDEEDGYVYIVYEKGEKIQIKAIKNSEIIYDGAPAGFLKKYEV